MSAEHSISMEQLLPLICESLSAGQSVRFFPKGTSMLPMLRQGKDSVVLSPLPEKLRKFDLPLYRRSNGQYVLHRIIKAGDSYTCIGDNQFEKEAGLRREQMIGIVTAFTRGDRQYSVSQWQYRLYCRLWHYSRGLRRLARGLVRRLQSFGRKEYI